MKNVFTLFVCILFSISLSWAQRPTEFSTSHAEFLKEFELFYTSSKRKVMEEGFKSFKKLFNGGTYTAEQKDGLITVFNLMLIQKMTADPYFSKLVESLPHIKKYQNGDQIYKDWLGVLTGMLNDIEKRKLNPFKEFAKFSPTFFEHKALKYSKSGSSWMAKADGFKMYYTDKQPIVEYDKVDLKCFRKKDTIVVQNTIGKFFPFEKKWIGEGGLVDWKRFSKDIDKSVDLGSYEIDLTKTLYKVKEATLNDEEFFGAEKIIGSFEDKLVARTKSSDGSYPRFESRDSVIEIKNLGDGILYKGGFRLQGLTVYGFGSSSQKAKLEVIQNPERSLRSFADVFVIRKGERIVGEQVATTLFFDQDSIFHPSVEFKFEIDKRKLQLTRGKRGSNRNPFFDSYHNTNISAERIEWHMKADSILIGAKSIGVGSMNKVVSFESLGYFNQNDYTRIQNIDDINPLAMLKVISDREGKRFLPTSTVAYGLNEKYTKSSIKPLLYDLVSEGFVGYDSDNEIVEIKDKIFRYADASRKKVDYDKLKLNSDSDETNAYFKISEGDIDISGVTRIEFSTPQRVAAKPLRGNLTLKKNRNIDFNGKLLAGLSVITGKGFSFDYDKFHIGLDSVRYVDLFAFEGERDEKENPIAYGIESRIEYLTGFLLIDAPANKSGNEDIEIFPSLQSKDKSYVFYDSRGTMNGCYDRDSFYFELDKFSFNSLDNYLVDAIRFKGTTYSADIFPPYEEEIWIQEDMSLGHITQTDSKGYPAFIALSNSGKGNYKGEISLSNKGYLGVGNVNYLKASVDSEDIIFRPDQLTCTANVFDLQEDRGSEVQIPQVHGDSVSIDWRPYKDSMYIDSEEGAFEMYKANDHTLAGGLILTPGGLKGNGLLDFSKGSMHSKYYNFGAFSVVSDTLDLQIKTEGVEDLAFDTKNVNGDLDFDKQYGSFTGNGEGFTTAMPYNQYVTDLNDFDWDLKNDIITFKTKPNELGSFMSTHPDQDSLIFQGATASYDIKQSKLDIGGVPFVKSADAFIYPSDNRVVIEKGGDMNQFTNAKIICDTVNRYHEINRATVQVKGKKLYEASGYYQYDVAGNTQEILFDNIIGQRVGKGKRREKRTVTRANGEVKEEDQFKIDVKTEYRGGISLNADQKELTFKGFANLRSDRLNRSKWFSVAFLGDKNDLKINYEEPKSYEGEPLTTGLHLSKEYAVIYPNIMATKLFRKDRDLIPTQGIFKYDKKDDGFIFGDSLRVIGQAQTGNVISFNDRTGKLLAEGKFNMSEGLPQDIMSVTAYGKAETEIPKVQGDSLTIESMVRPVKVELMSAIEMFVPEELLNLIVTDIQSFAFDAQDIDYTDHKFYAAALPVLFENPKVRDPLMQKVKVGRFELEKKSNPYTFIFEKMDLIWNPEYQSFVSKKDKNGLIMLAGKRIHKKLTSYMEYKMPSNGDDRLYIYLKSPGGNFYFFGYKQGILNLSSNNTQFMEELENMKSKKLTKKMDDGELFEILPVNTGTAQAFINRVKSARTLE